MGGGQGGLEGERGGREIVILGMMIDIGMLFGWMAQMELDGMGWDGIAQVGFLFQQAISVSASGFWFSFHNVHVCNSVNICTIILHLFRKCT